MDKMLALEMTWLRGTAMVQTLFTCLYCQRPAAIQNKTLRVYCQGLLKTCEVSKRAASRASVYEVRRISLRPGRGRLGRKLLLLLRLLRAGYLCVCRVLCAHVPFDRAPHCAIFLLRSLRP
jgi:hypothetical protein